MYNVFDPPGYRGDGSSEKVVSTFSHSSTTRRIANYSFKMENTMAKKQPSRRTQAERTEASDKAIYKAAIKLIAKEGPANMSLAKLGKLAGFSGGLVSYRFGSKGNMLKAVADRILELWERRVLAPALSNESALDDLKTLSKLYLDSVKNKSDLILAQFRLMNDSYSTHKELKQQFSDFDCKARGLMINLMEKGQASGEIKKSVDAHGFSVIFIGMLRGTAMQYFVNEKNIDLDQTAEMIADILDTIKAD